MFGLFVSQMQELSWAVWAHLGGLCGIFGECMLLLLQQTNWTGWSVQGPMKYSDIVTFKNSDMVIVNQFI